MLMPLCRADRPEWRTLSSRRGIAFLEFALIAPVTVTVLFGVYDISRALIVWEEVNNAAEAIAQAAEKLSVSPDLTQTMLTATQMQNAMSTIYPQVPGLNRGDGTGSFPGAFAVTLSGVVYSPLCKKTSGCAAQTPYTLWTTYLTEGGAQLITTSTAANPLQRSCGKLTAVSQFPNDSTQLTKMLDPSKVAGGVSMTLTPQVVADVRYVFTSSFSTFISPVTFWASAVAPAPLGGTSQGVSFNATAPIGNVVSCTPPP